MTTALILFGHGAREPAWAEPLLRVQAAIREQAPGLPVELAFLEFLAPTLADCAAGLVASGARKVVVLPMFIAQGGHLKRDLPDKLEQLRAAHSGVDFVLAPVVGESAAVIRAMAAVAVQAAALEFARSPVC
ncbi:MAG: CbiX/SirB N-terminal domain-containing protein [Azonexus sp.]|jgi:sirohydrochlorin cobaltochelatase|uniref:sirohydrochlorin chelatase n=1 Tax=Azonexus sp. TaxID=1872668 RepID=UPI00283A7706|nr:CbiX/SirB N-terminal domain-containing protein [Azonexus sp.]MDR0777636.1 CbiX/SirB N-terminal domain-containing protein [Azonexus sp.]